MATATSREPWCFGLRPLSKVARDGVVRGMGAMARVKSRPRAASASIVGVGPASGL